MLCFCQTEKNGAQPNSILGEAHYLNKDDLEIYSRDYKGSPSNLVTGMRDRPPMSYSLRMESFNTLLQSNETERYESRPFPVGGYNWSLIVYPNGNRQDSGSGFISLYLAIDNSTLVSSHQEVFADLRFYVFKRTERNFFTVQDTDVWRYNIFKTMWGFPRVLPLDTFRNPSNGYLFNGDNCEFGVDVTVHSPFESSELFTVARNFPNPRFTWTIQRFSTLVGDTHLSNTNIQVNPRGRSTGAGRAMSMYLILNANEKVRPNEKIYVRARLRVINQRIFSLLWTTIERPIDHWFTTPGLGWGYDEFISLDDLRDFWKGYVMGDVLIVEVEMEAISSTKYFPKENGAGPNPNLGEANYEDKYQEISSRDYKVSASNAVKGLRDRPPSSYILKMESFNTLLKSNYAERYESRPFAVCGYNWTLVVYPNGNKKDSGSGYLSLYVAIDNSTLVGAQQEVLADLRFYIFNNNERKYFTIQDTTVWRFNVFKTMWGFSQVLPVDTFKDPKNGYLYDGDHCEFGVDVIIPSIAENSELFSATEKFYNPTFTWTIRGFSTLLKDMYSSDVFTIGGRMYPNGRGEGEGKFLSMFLKLNGEEKLRPYEKVYVRAKLRVLNQSKLNNVQNQLDSWFSRAVPSWGFRKLISFDDLRDSSKGFLVNDMLMVQVEMEAVSSTKYFP
ncbi:hypothetical protein IGI04_012111 [Brassica rapa subsp. trilocularis]|uniref:MATH domain-containing protein n=1 Tax=Brassica rapa subsp. trilocularis TaxID=1813537 RepID=A0ABQ7N504_BRACM|nr:hypothetical protein IGI04_012111 [Brassica rapa subsp. trilocularis]